jgi:hypothetical protein
MDADNNDDALVHAALDALMQVLAKSADDLRNFHDALARLRKEGKVPFPRTVVATTENVVQHLTTVEDQLRKLTVAAGL